jgi:acyl carrier protein
MKDAIIEYIQSQLLRGRSDYAISGEDDLLGSGLLDSMGMMKLIAFIEKHFDTSVPPQDMVIENFMTVDAIGRYLSAKAAPTAPDGQ